MSRVISVAAVQLNCAPGKVKENLSHAERYIEEAAGKGAKLVLLPELMPSGYMATEEIWDFAETIKGHSVNWLLDTARTLGVYLGFSFFEADGEDFYNSFVLSSPSGELLGRVRKNPPASIEAYFYKAGSDRHVIETDLGKIGVGICYENLLYSQMCDLYDENVDLVLSPTAAGRPVPFIPGDVKRLEKMLINSRSVFANTLGVPVIMANRVGPLETELPGNSSYIKTSFAGLSSIVDSNGTVKSKLHDEEGVIISAITIGSTSKLKNKPKKYGKMWSMPVPWFAFIWPLAQRKGEKKYANSFERKQRALSISRDKAVPP